MILLILNEQDQNESASTSQTVTKEELKEFLGEDYKKYLHETLDKLSKNNKYKAAMKESGVMQFLFTDGQYKKVGEIIQKEKITSVTEDNIDTVVNVILAYKGEGELTDGERNFHQIKGAVAYMFALDV